MNDNAINSNNNNCACEKIHASRVSPWTRLERFMLKKVHMVRIKMMNEKKVESNLSEGINPIVRNYMSLEHCFMLLTGLKSFKLTEMLNFLLEPQTLWAKSVENSLKCTSNNVVSTIMLALLSPTTNMNFISSCTIFT